MHGPTVKHITQSARIDAGPSFLSFYLLYSLSPFLSRALLSHSATTTYRRQLIHIEDQPVASLASRISGLTTSNDPTPPQSQSQSQTETEVPPTTKGSETRPKFNAGGNNLFGRALAGANRPSSSTTASSSKSTEEKKEEKPGSEPEPVKNQKEGQDKMAINLMDSNEG